MLLIITVLAWPKSSVPTTTTPTISCQYLNTNQITSATTFDSSGTGLVNVWIMSQAQNQYVDLGLHNGSFCFSINQHIGLYVIISNGSPAPIVTETFCNGPNFCNPMETFLTPLSEPFLSSGFTGYMTATIALCSGQTINFQANPTYTIFKVTEAGQTTSYSIFDNTGYCSTGTT